MWESSIWKRALKDTLPELGYHNLGNLIRTIIISVIAVFIIRYIGGWVEMAEQMRWVVASIIALGVVFIGNFLWNLARAPIFIRFEKEKEPRLAIDSVVRSHYGQKGHSWDLVIKNLGTDRADDCRGTLIDIDFARYTEGFSMEWWPKNEQLQWAELPPGMVGEFSIPSLESRNLHVIINELSKSQTQADNIPEPAIYIAYARDELSRGRSPLTSAPCFRPTSVIDVDSTSSILIISVTSKNRVPIYAVCYIHEDRQKFYTDYKLEILEKNIKAIPSIVEYRRRGMRLKRIK